MVRYWVHTPGTDNACDGPTPSPAIMHFLIYKITNLLLKENKRILKTDKIPDGWKKGRKFYK